MDSVSERRLAENEVIFKQLNEEVKAFVLEDASDTEFATKKLGFYCECSNMDCRQRIRLTAKEYDDIHSNEKRFVLLPGHDMPQVETVVTKSEDHMVVEKINMPPLPEDIDPKRFI